AILLQVAVLEHADGVRSEQSDVVLVLHQPCHAVLEVGDQVCPSPVMRRSSKRSSSCRITRGSEGTVLLGTHPERRPGPPPSRPPRRTGPSRGVVPGA